MQVVNPESITFGIEIECYAPGVQVGGYHAGRSIPGFPAGWNAQADGSLGSGGTEIVSPVLKGRDGINQVQAVCEKLNSLNAKVDGRCGFHVHIGFDHTNAEALKRLIYLVANFEKALFAATGTKRREASCYCKGISRDFRNLQLGRPTRSLGHVAGDR